jgi:signal transduction histidine kinase/integral membrane sensor domain MASE1
MAESRFAFETLTRSPRGRDAILVVAVGAGYYLGALLGSVLRFPPAVTSVIWPPNALLTAALLLVPPRRWWLCIAAALPAHVLVLAQAGFAPAFALTLFGSNCLEAVVAASAVRLWSDDPNRFDSLQRSLAFVVGAVLLGPLVSTFPDAAAVHYFRGEPYDLVCVRRMLSNSLSQLTLVPSTVLLVRHLPTWLRAATRRQRVEATGLALALVTVGWLVFNDSHRPHPSLPGGPYTALPFLLPLIIVSAVRFGPFGASLSLLTTALLAIGSALSGRSPLPDLPAEQRVMALQVFLIVVGVPLLFVSALMRERAQIADTLRQRLRFEELLSQLSGAFVHLPSDKMHLEFQASLERLARFFELDACGLWLLTHGGKAFQPVAWHGPSASQPPSSLGRASFGWCAERILSRQSIVSSDVETLPTRGDERERLRRLGMRSLLALPLAAGGEVIGALALVSTSSHRSWPEPVVGNSRLVADVLAGALARMLAENALRASESMKSAVLASLASLVAVLDREGRIIAVNESWTRFGRLHSPEANVVGPGESYLEICRRAAESGDELARDAQLGIQGVLDHDLPSFTQDYRAPGSDGDRWFHMTAVPLDRPEGGAVVSHTDITERRHAEAEADKSRQELAHYLRVSTIGEMTTSIAHELNQPLAAILANAQTARKILAAPDTAEGRREVEEIIGDIIDEDRRAGEVIRGLRELLRKGQGAQEELDVNVLVRGVLRLLGNDVMLRGVSMRSELTDEALTTRGDRVQLQQVLLNLVVNALEALADSDGDRRIGIRTERAFGMARVSVEDSGPGLPGPVEREIFKPFFTTKPKGMGMGLSIARSILGAHGGTISVDKGRERGARFSFTLPLVEAARAPRA